MGVVSKGSLGPCSIPWTLLIGDGVPVECPGGINEFLGAQTVVLLVTVYPGLPRFVLPLVLIHLFWHWCSATLEHFYYRYLHVKVCHLGESLGYMHMHHPNAHGMHSV